MSSHLRYAPTLDRLGWLYEVGSRVCFDSTELRKELRSMRGRKSACHSDCALTIAQLASISGVPFGTVSKAESVPDGVSLGIMRKLTAAHGKRLAIVIYDDDQPVSNPYMFNSEVK